MPDPDLPFLSVHFTRRVDGSIEAGPNVVLALRREGYRKTDISVVELGQAMDFGGFWRMARASGGRWAPASTTDPSTKPRL